MCPAMSTTPNVIGARVVQWGDDDEFCGIEVEKDLPGEGLHILSGHAHRNMPAVGKNLQLRQRIAHFRKSLLQ